MKSRIKWTTNINDISAHEGGHETIHHRGEVEGCCFYLNIYSFNGEWCWTVRGKWNPVNYFASHGSHKDLDYAKKEAAKWAVMLFLRMLHPNIVKGESDAHSIYWFQPFDVEHLRPSFSRKHKVK